MNDLLSGLAAAPGIYRGGGDGPESGPFHARLEVRAVVGGRAVVLDYEAVGTDGVMRVDHCMLAEDERARLELNVVTDELPGIVRFTQSEPGRFVAFDPVKTKIVIDLDSSGVVTYAWWWTRDDTPAQAQTKAVLKRVP